MDNEYTLEIRMTGMQEMDAIDLFNYIVQYAKLGDYELSGGYHEQVSEQEERAAIVAAADAIKGEE